MQSLPSRLVRAAALVLAAVFCLSAVSQHRDGGGVGVTASPIPGWVPHNYTMCLMLDFVTTAANRYEDWSGVHVAMRMANDYQLMMPRTGPYAGQGVYFNYTFVRTSSTTSPGPVALVSAQILKSRGCNIIIGPSASGNAPGIAQYALDNQMIFVAPFSNVVSFTVPPLLYYPDRQGIGYQAMYRATPHLGHGGVPIIPFLQRFNFTMIAVCGETYWGTSVYSLDYVNYFINKLKFRVRSSTNYNYQQPTNDPNLLTPQLQQIKNSGARVILWVMDENPFRTDLQGIRTAAIINGMYGNGYTWIFTWEAWNPAVWLFNATQTGWPGAVFMRERYINSTTDTNPFRNMTLNAWRQHTNRTQPTPPNTAQTARLWDDGDRAPAAQAQNAIDSVWSVFQAMARVQFAGYDPTVPNNTQLVAQALTTRQVWVDGVRVDDDSNDDRFFRELYNERDTFNPLTQDRMYKTEYINFQPDPVNGGVMPVVIGVYDGTQALPDWTNLPKMQWSVSGNETAAGLSSIPLDGSQPWGRTSSVRGDTNSAQFTQQQALEVLIRNSFTDAVTLKEGELTLTITHPDTGARLDVVYSVELVYELDPANFSAPPQLVVGTYRVPYLIKSIGLEDPGTYTLNLHLRDQAVSGTPGQLALVYPPGFLRVGKPVFASADYGTNVIAAAVAVVGAWTGLSFLDHALGLGDHAPLLQLSYLAVGAVSFGVGLWGAVLVSLSSLTLPSVVTFTSATVMGSLPIPIVLCAVLLWVLARYTRTRTKHKVTKLEITVGMTHSDVEDRRVTHRLRAWQAVLSCVLITGACVAVLAIVYTGVDVEASISLSITTNVVGLILCVLLAGVAPYTFFKFFNSAARMIAPIVYGGAIVIGPYLCLTDLAFVFSNSPADAAKWGPMTVRYIGLFSGVGVALVLVALNVTRLRLSKDELLRMVKLMRVKLDDTRAQLMAERAQNAELRALLHLNALLRPQPSVEHFSLLRYLAVTQRNAKLQAANPEMAAERYIVDQPSIVGSTTGSTTNTRASLKGGTAAAMRSSPKAAAANAAPHSGGVDEKDGAAVEMQALSTSAGATSSGPGGPMEGAPAVGVAAPLLPGEVQAPAVAAPAPAADAAVAVPVVAAAAPAAADVSIAVAPVADAVAPAPVSAEQPPAIVVVHAAAAAAPATEASPATATRSVMESVGGSSASAGLSIAPTTTMHHADPQTNASANDSSAAAGSGLGSMSPLLPFNTLSPVQSQTNTHGLALRTDSLSGVAATTVIAPSGVSGGSTGTPTAGTPTGLTMSSPGTAAITGNGNSAAANRRQLKVAGGPGGRVASVTNAPSGGSPHANSTFVADGATSTTGAPAASASAAAGFGGRQRTVKASQSESSKLHKLKPFDFGLIGLKDATPLPDLTNADLSLDDVLSHPVCLELLKDQMVQHHTVESIRFYLEVQAWKTLDAEDSAAHVSRILIAQAITRSYIADGAPHEINISHDLRQAINAKISDGKVPTDVFAQAESEVFKLIRMNDLPRLRESEAGLVCKALLRARPVTGMLQSNELFNLPSHVTDSVRRNFVAAGGRSGGGHSVNKSTAITATIAAPIVLQLPLPVPGDERHRDPSPKSAGSPSASSADASKSRPKASVGGMSGTAGGKGASAGSAKSTPLQPLRKADAATAGGVSVSVAVDSGLPGAVNSH